MDTNARIYIAGHRGLVGSAIERSLRRSGFERLVLRTHAELDLLDASAVSRHFHDTRPTHVVIAAAKVGGILANKTEPVDFLLKNLTIQNNLISSAHRVGVRKLLFLGSSCIYPKYAPQPIREDSLLTGALEPTNDAYALAKIAGIKLCDAYNRQHGTDFLSAMPTNMYGPGDNFDLRSSHVLPAMIRKFHLAKLARAGEHDALARDVARFGAIPEGVAEGLLQGVVSLWGSGSPRREFLYSDDLADACVFLLREVSAATLGGEATDDRNPCALINVGYGDDVSIRDLADCVQRVVGFDGEVRWDPTKPDGTPRKLMDSSRIRALGWAPKVDLEEGVRRAYAWYLDALAGS
ncbi:MAG: GDP-L-fucose synthase [Polyangiales bacterium]